MFGENCRETGCFLKKRRPVFFHRDMTNPAAEGGHAARELEG
ncbi:hypothetical protein DCCM_4835 [Desulfocucumis palustris]|uniref:Uncharacterized protein n=1 Tax=Desulfocucumis palustris TaxID=1898651 RepID=A0A2L2XMY1_9FIRM|nr:hypothetical protein DCCM_4835 [Desulfocucumis palustris]